MRHAGWDTRGGTRGVGHAGWDTRGGTRGVGHATFHKLLCILQTFHMNKPFGIYVANTPVKV